MVKNQKICGTKMTGRTTCDAAMIRQWRIAFLFHSGMKVRGGGEKQAQQKKPHADFSSAHRKLRNRRLD
jgi:hypothetical protein